MHKAKLMKLGNKLVLVVKEEEVFELHYKFGDKPEDTKVEHKSWDMMSEQEHNVIFGTAIKEYVQEQETLLDTVFEPALSDVEGLEESDINGEDRETVSEDTSADEK